MYEKKFSKKKNSHMQARPKGAATKARDLGPQILEVSY